MKAGNCVLTAKSTDGGFESSINLRVVNTIAPTSYEISLNDHDISLGTTQTLNFDIDGGVLGHDELINFRYYDTRKLCFSSSDEAVATVDENGVVYPHTTGTSTISVTNGSYSKSVDINVISGTPAPLYSSLSISGSGICYSNDMLLNQNNKEKYHYQLMPKDGETNLNPEDFIWTSSNELLAKVDKHGVLRGFRKDSFDDETVIITAKSKTTGQSATHEVIVKSQLPTEIYYYFNVDGTPIWNQTDYTFTIGENISLEISYNATIQNKQVEVSCTDASIIEITNEGSSVNLHIKKQGNCVVTITSVINPELSKEITCTAVKAGAISKDNYLSVRKYLRKSVGHAAVFMVAQFFTFLTLFAFLYEKKWWFYSSISLGEGLLISILSELIQYFVPTRTGAILDVLIDFSGVVVGFTLVFACVLIIKKVNKKRNQNNREAN